MIYKILEVEFTIIKNEYQIQKLLIDNKKQYLADILNVKEDTTYISNDLSKLYIYILTTLLKNGFENTNGKLSNKQFSFVYKNGKCNNIKIKYQNKNIFVINFKSKFGVEYKDFETSQMLIDYAIKKARTGQSVGADAYNEFVSMKLPTTRYMPVVAHKIMRTNEHYPIFEYNADMLEAKENVSGYQFANQGEYNNLIEYDISSSYPAQLLCNMPKGLPKEYTTIEDVPSTYFKIFKFSYFNLEIKPNKIDFIKVSKMGQLCLTEKMFELFIDTYSCCYCIKKIYAFKTEKSPFAKFIKTNIIDGKIKEKNEYIAKYNKYIGNSIIGYFGRNTTTTDSIIDKKCKITEISRNIDPIYLPVYLAVLDKAKSKFIRTINKYKNCIVYANTDGFLSKEPLSVNELNYQNSLPIGSFREKTIYKYIYIDCVNGYSGITSDGEIDNTISGMTLESIVDPELYKNRQFEYYINIPTARGTIRRVKVKPSK